MNAAGSQDQPVAGGVLPATGAVPAAYASDKADATDLTTALDGLEQAFSHLARRWRSATVNTARAVHHDLDPAGYVLLVRLATCPDQRASDLASAQAVGKGTMSRQLTRLEELGLVERVANPGDARSQLLRLTADGATRLKTVRARRAAALRGILAEQWDAPQVRQATAVLDELSRTLAAVQRLDAEA